jgi:prepilin-type N-terminal cleavage/methylation domain-containing protein
MNASPLPTTSSYSKASPRGFTLIELIVVIAIIALLSSLTIGAFSYATAAAGRNRTEATKAALVAGLERYYTEFGEYPQPSNPGATETFNGKPYRAGGAEMLYQAMSGDGTSAIQLASGGNRGSDGIIDDLEAKNIMMQDMPKDLYVEVNRRFYIVDGFRRPFQYTKGGTPTAVNPTYDLWSYGQDDPGQTTEEGIAQKTNPQIASKWIHNW